MTPNAITHPLQIWAGLECTINRVGNDYYDQLEYSGHYGRCEDDIAAIAALGVKTLRYPLLWERHQPEQGWEIEWSFATNAMAALQEHGITPIAGLVHHGSGPAYVSFYDGSFEEGLAAYALQVAQRFPHIEYYTPVNEPVTTARFCGLYGFWHPHRSATEDFCRILLSECKATVLAMQAIRSVNPSAKLVQTEDLGKTYSTPLLQYQADCENRRRWLGFELLCGRITPEHEGWRYLTEAGVHEDELRFFLENPTPPGIMGLNYYATSERYIDQSLRHYPTYTHGGNGIHAYADIEAVRAPVREKTGLDILLRDAWKRYGLPIAITEVHLHCHREHQCRWLHRAWQTACALREEGIEIRAVTAWAALGSFGWSRMLRQPGGEYESGLFDVRGGKPRPTALAKLVQTLAAGQDCTHPVFANAGWWERPERILYRRNKLPLSNQDKMPHTESRPLLILGKTGTLGSAFARICAERGIHHVLWSRQDLDLNDEAAIAPEIAALAPWAVVNATGYVRVEDAEQDSHACFQVNCVGAVQLARACAEASVPLLSFSSDLVFDGKKGSPYTESDTPRPLNNYGRSKAAAEDGILHHHPGTLVVRTSAFFGPWDAYNFVHAVLRELSAGRPFRAASDVVVTPTYVPDLAHLCLDLLQDGASGIWHISNGDAVSWAELAYRVAERVGLPAHLVEPLPQAELGGQARQPLNAALRSERGITLPSLEHALDRFFAAQEHWQPEWVLATV